MLLMCADLGQGLGEVWWVTGECAVGSGGLGPCRVKGSSLQRGREGFSEVWWSMRLETGTVGHGIVGDRQLGGTLCGRLIRTE